MCLQVFTEGDRKLYEELKPFAMKLGSAFQKIIFYGISNRITIRLEEPTSPNLDMTVFDNTVKSQIENEIHTEFKEGRFGNQKTPSFSKVWVYLAYKYYLFTFREDP